MDGRRRCHTRDPSVRALIVEYFRAEIEEEFYHLEAPALPARVRAMTERERSDLDWGRQPLWLD